MTIGELNLTFVGYGSIAAAPGRELGGVRFDCMVGRRPKATEAFGREHAFRHWTLSLAEALARPGAELVVTCYQRRRPAVAECS